MGRWKSGRCRDPWILKPRKRPSPYRYPFPGAPVCMTPWNDDPNLAKANNYDYKPLDKQDKCPFAAHARKCNPRADLSHPERFVIMRRGISYGGEVTHKEWKDHKTSMDRGLLFMCYQSNIANGFRMQQASKPSCPILSPSIATLTLLQDGATWTPSLPTKTRRPGIQDPALMPSAASPIHQTLLTSVFAMGIVKTVAST